jgi:hypothetical protein
MTKKISILILTLAASLTAAAHHYEVANADSVTIYYNDVTAGYGSNAVEVVYKGTWYGAYPNTYKDTVNIPDKILVDGKQFKVIGIGEQAFSQSFNLKSVTIPESIEYIRDKAFENCYNIAEVNYNAVRCADFTMPEYAPFSFGNMAYSEYVYPEDDDSYPDKFWSAYKLRTINIGASVERVPDYMFYGMGGTLQQADFTKRPTKTTTTKEGVTAVNFLGTPKEIGNQVFRRCPLLQSLEIPNGVQSVGQALFADCDTLATVVLPDYIEEIPAYFFMNCKELANFAFPTHVQRINFEAFKNCAKLTDLNNLPAGLKVIGPSAFRACEFITSVNLPEGLETIDGYSFSDCTGLTSIEIPGTVEIIGNYAFEDCTNLTTVTMHEGTKEIGNFVFAGCRKLSKGILNAPARMPRIYAQTFQGVDNSMTVNVAGGDEQEYAADAYWGRFFAPQGVEEVTTTTRKAHKVIRDGNVYILRDGKTFDILGNEFK